MARTSGRESRALLIDLFHRFDLAAHSKKHKVLGLYMTPDNTGEYKPDRSLVVI